MGAPLSPFLPLVFRVLRARILADQQPPGIVRMHLEAIIPGHCRKHEATARFGGRSCRARHGLGTTRPAGRHTAADRSIYTPCFCAPSEAARTINLRSSRSKRLASVRNSYASSSKAALLSSSLVL